MGLPKELSMCGATSWLLLVLSASTCAGIWCLKESWRETSGMWRMKGGLFQMRRASKSWRSALQSFALRPRFGRMECTSARQMMCGAGPPTQKRWKNRSGKCRASWFAHAMRCSCGTTARIASLLDSTAFWRDSLMHVVCVCVKAPRNTVLMVLNNFKAGGQRGWGGLWPTKMPPPIPCKRTCNFLFKVQQGYRFRFDKNKMSIATFRFSFSFQSLAGGQRGWGGSLANEDAPPIPCKRTFFFPRMARG